MDHLPLNWVLVLVVLGAMAFAIPGLLRHSAGLAVAAGNAAILLLVVMALAWFLYHVCLSPRFRLRHLQRIRVKQGRRHPLA